jgi:hypothetical protein
MYEISFNLGIVCEPTGPEPCGQAVAFLGGGGMHGSELYRKYRQLIEGLADERRSTELSLTTLHALLQQFESEAGTLESAAAGFVCDEIADQLEQEALRATSRHRTARGRQGLRRHVVRWSENLTQSVRERPQTTQ